MKLNGLENSQDLNLTELREKILLLNERLNNDMELSDIDKEILKIDIGNLTDEWKRRTFHISCVEEDNYI